MSLQPGQVLLQYRVVEKIGEGGMGEVYRAEDTRLHRMVAIKILPDELAKDPAKVSRLQNEARFLAALNHPNIASIHGLEESDGVHFLALEYVQGDTLAEQLAGGAMPVKSALAFCTQIASSLEAAHKAGIIHRDLKPANIMVTPDGQLKVLDFGLAKAFAADSSASQFAEAPTRSAGLTRPHAVLGTTPYMSPEQAAGKIVDKRTDIWAFGCVLYESLTGQPAFAGDTVSATLAAIHSHEPDWEQLPAGTPAEVRKLLRRCLEKDLDRRLRDIGDARIELEETLTHGSHHIARQGTRSGRRKLGLLAGASLVATLGAVALVSSLNFWPAQTQDAPAAHAELVNRIAVLDFRALTNSGESVSRAALMSLVQVGLAETFPGRIISPELLYDLRRRKLGSRRGETDHEQSLLLAREAGASHLVAGELTDRPTGYLVTWRLVGASAGQVLAGGKVEGKQIAGLADSIIEGLRDELGSGDTDPNNGKQVSVEALTSSVPEAFRAYAIALFYSETGRNVDALRQLEKAVALDPTFALAWHELSKAYDPNTQQAKATEAAQVAWSLRTRLGERGRWLLEALGLRLQYRGADAHQIYERLLRLWPDDRESLIARASNHAHFLDIGPAARAAADGLSYYPQDPDLLTIQAETQKAFGSFQESIQTYEQLLQLEPSSLTALLGMASVYLSMGEPDRAQVQFARILELEPDHFDANIGMSLCAFARGDLAGAIASQEDILASSRFDESQKQSLRSRWTIGLPALYMAAGRYEEALRTARMLGPSHTPERLAAEFLLRLGQADRALELYAKQVQTPRVAEDGLSTATAARDRSVWAAVVAEAGDLTEAQVALRDFERSVASDPNLPAGFRRAILRLAARIALAKHRPEQALAHLTRLDRVGRLRYGWSDLDDRDLLWRSQRDARDLDGATHTLRGLLRVHGGYSLAHLHLGTVLEEQGALSEARREYERFLLMWADADADLPHGAQAIAALERLKTADPHR